MSTTFTFNKTVVTVSDGTEQQAAKFIVDQMKSAKGVTPAQAMEYALDKLKVIEAISCIDDETQCGFNLLQLAFPEREEKPDDYVDYDDSEHTPMDATEM